MAFISKVQLYRDIGYTPDSLFVPARGSELGEPFMTYGELHPSQDRLFKEIRLPGSYPDLLDTEYAAITYTFGTEESRTFFFWVTNAYLLYDTEEPITVLGVEVDLWRTWIGEAVLDFGVVKARPQSAADPIQSIQWRYRLPGDFTSLEYTGVAQDLMWMCISYTERDYRSWDGGTERTSKISFPTTMFFPVDKTNPSTYYSIKLGDEQYECISLQDIIEGGYDEKLGLSPTSISSAYITPVPPFEIYSFIDGVVEMKAKGSTEDIISTSYVYPRYGITENGWSRYPPGCKISMSYSDGTNENRQLSGKSAMDSYLDSYVGYLQPTLTNNMTVTCSVNGAVTTYYGLLPLDDYIKTCLGDRWGTLAVGNTVTLNTDTVFLLRSPSRSTALNSPTLYTYSYEITIRADAIQRNGSYTLTYDGSTFQSDWSHIYIAYNGGASFTLSYSRSQLTYDVVIECNNWKDSSTTHQFGWFRSNSNFFFEHQQSLPSAVTTSETREWIVTDLSGSPVASLPWGIECSDYTVRDVVTQTSCYVEYRFRGVDSRAAGVCISIPVPPVDITSNSWSDYLYSGQREYDKAQRQIASEQALVQGVASSVTGGVSNSIFAGIGSTKSPLAVGAASVGIGSLTSVIQYGLSLWHNDRLQDAEDQLRANQVDTILSPSDGWDWLYHGRSIGLVSLVPDDYSLLRFRSQIDWNGIRCDEPTESCDGLLDAGGPLRIENLLVRGTLPPQAKEYIKQRLSDGVYVR